MAPFVVASVLSLSLAVAASAANAGGGAPAPRSAVARLEPRSGSAAKGSARFVPAGAAGLRIRVEVEGATPGEHGLHLHEKGDCSDPKAASAGGHFNPGASPHHGAPAAAVHHGGDLGNLEVGPDGKGTLELVVQGLSLSGATDGIIGRSLVLHEKADDLHTDPSGNSGGRIACGVVAAGAAARHTVP